MSMTYLVAMRSEDPSTHSGCVIATKNNRFITSGYNGLPRGVKVTSERLERPEKYLWFEHGERNAIYNTTQSLYDSKAYINWFPCNDCARGLIQAGVKHIIVHKEGQELYESINPGSHWEGKMVGTIQMFKEAGVLLEVKSIKIVAEITAFFSGKEMSLQQTGE